jgi:hypothetical protein
MTSAARMLAASPSTPMVDAVLLAEAIEALEDCAQACIACADSCLGASRERDRVECVTACLNCADVCTTVCRILTRQAGYDDTIGRSMTEASGRVLKVCADACKAHAVYDKHARICEEVCGRAEQAIQRLLVATVTLP